MLQTKAWRGQSSRCLKLFKMTNESIKVSLRLLRMSREPQRRKLTMKNNFLSLPSRQLFLSISHSSGFPSDAFFHRNFQLQFFLQLFLNELKTMRHEISAVNRISAETDAWNYSMLLWRHNSAALCNCLSSDRQMTQGGEKCEVACCNEDDIES